MANREQPQRRQRSADDKLGWRQPRQPSADDKVALAFLETFKTPAGQLVLQHLRSAFINTVMPAEATDAQLRYREGQRSVIGIIDTRIKEGTNYARKQSA